MIRTCEVCALFNETRDMNSGGGSCALTGDCIYSYSMAQGGGAVDYREDGVFPKCPYKVMDPKELELKLKLYDAEKALVKLNTLIYEIRSLI